MWDLQHPPKGRTVGKIKDHLSSIYRIYLRSGTLKLTFNGEPLHTTSQLFLWLPRMRAHSSQPCSGESTSRSILETVSA